MRAILLAASLILVTDVARADTWRGTEIPFCAYGYQINGNSCVEWLSSDLRLGYTDVTRQPINVSPHADDVGEALFRYLLVFIAGFYLGGMYGLLAGRRASQREPDNKT